MTETIDNVYTSQTGMHIHIAFNFQWMNITKRGRKYKYNNSLFLHSFTQRLPPYQGFHATANCDNHKFSSPSPPLPSHPSH